MLHVWAVRPVDTEIAENPAQKISQNRVLKFTLPRPCAGGEARAPFYVAPVQLPGVP